MIPPPPVMPPPAPCQQHDWRPLAENHRSRVAWIVCRHCKKVEKVKLP